MKDPKEKLNNVRQEIDLRLDGLLGELGNVLGEALSRLDQGSGEVRRTFEAGSGAVRGEAGIRVRMGGAEVSQSSRPLPEVKPKADPAVRDISTTILEEPGFWSLSADLPGVAFEDLSVRLEGQTLSIKAVGRGRNYATQVEIPTGLREEALQVSLNNGILDICAEVPE